MGISKAAVAGPSVVRARVTHARRLPVVNRFAYGVDYLLLDEAALAGGPGPKLFSYNRPNLMSLYPSDHGVGGHHGFQGVRGLMAEAGIDAVERLLLLAHPRYWGYAFNPVSFWFALDTAGGLRGVLAEVHNTFGERHGYLCRGARGGVIKRHHRIVADKRFHVSPFFDVRGEYRFSFLLQERRVAVRIIYDDGAGGGLSTAITGQRRPFTDRELAGALLRRPLGAARTTALIHWQALRLYCKGLAVRRKPEPPEQGVSW